MHMARDDPSQHARAACVSLRRDWAQCFRVWGRVQLLGGGLELRFGSYPFLSIGISKT